MKVIIKLIKGRSWVIKDALRVTQSATDGIISLSVNCKKKGYTFKIPASNISSICVED